MDRSAISKLRAIQRPQGQTRRLSCEGTNCLSEEGRRAKLSSREGNASRSSAVIECLGKERAMKLCVKSLALASGILWAGCVFCVGVANLIWAGYGVQFLQWLSSFYPGYDADRHFGQVVIATLYALIDGLLGGAVFAWLYNRFDRSKT
jgi:hypothetical protein